MIKQRLKLLRSALKEFMAADCLNLAAALSYYTVFSLAPMLIVIIAISSLFFGKEAVTGTLFHQIKGLVGPDAAESIQTMIAHGYQPKSSIIATIIGVLTLAFGSTGVFNQMQYCLNKIWGVKPKAREKRQWLEQVKDRFLSFGMLLALVFLLLVSLAASAALAGLWGYIQTVAPDITAVALKVLELAISLTLMTGLFTMMFKFLPDVKLKIRDVWKGGALTAVLFEVGKNLIGLYLGKSNVASTYGGAGAIVIIMLWVNYSALILFFGASYTKAYTLLKGKKAAPEEYAVSRPDRDEKDRQVKAA
jgi:membrane protein